MGYGADGGEADDVVDRAQAEIYDVTERRTSEDYVRSPTIMQATLDEIEAIVHRGGAMVGVPTGFAELDELTNGLHPGQMIVVAARPGSRQGAGAGHAAADADRLDDDGRGRRRRPAARRGRPADPGGRGHRGDDRPSLLRGRVLRRHGDRRRRRSTSGSPRPAPPVGCGRGRGRAAVRTTQEIEATACAAVPRTNHSVDPALAPGARSHRRPRRGSATGRLAHYTSRPRDRHAHRGRGCGW